MLGIVNDGYVVSDFYKLLKSRVSHSLPPQ